MKINKIGISQIFLLILGVFLPPYSGYLTPHPEWGIAGKIQSRWRGPSLLRHAGWPRVSDPPPRWRRYASSERQRPGRARGCGRLLRLHLCSGPFSPRVVSGSGAFLRASRLTSGTCSMPRWRMNLALKTSARAADTGSNISWGTRIRRCGRSWSAFRRTMLCPRWRSSGPKGGCRRRNVSDVEPEHTRR